MSKSAIECTLMLLNVHAYFIRAIESFVRANEVILLNQRPAQINDYFALMTSERCSYNYF